MVLDAGALIALERSERSLTRRLKALRKRGGTVVVPASVLAEAWRGGPRSAPIARLLNACRVDDLNETRAKEVGQRLGSRNAKQIADAHVVCCALEHEGVVATTDAEDVEALCEGPERLAVIQL